MCPVLKLGPGPSEKSELLLIQYATVIGNLVAFDIEDWGRLSRGDMWLKVLLVNIVEAIVYYIGF